MSWSMTEGNDWDRPGRAPCLEMSSWRTRPPRWFKLTKGQDRLGGGTSLTLFVPKRNGDRAPGTGEIHGQGLIYLLGLEAPTSLPAWKTGTVI